MSDRPGLDAHEDAAAILATIERRVDSTYSLSAARLAAICRLALASSEPTGDSRPTTGWPWMDREYADALTGGSRQSGGLTLTERGIEEQERRHLAAAAPSQEEPTPASPEERA